jgi:rubrerythrin
MNNKDLSFLDAVRMAIEAEKNAVAFYTDAAQKTTNSLTRKLLEQLAEFEDYHRAKLVDLEKSLCENGACILYEGKRLLFRVPDEMEKLQEADRMSAIEVIITAIDIKQKAEERYKAMAEQTADPNGRTMFIRLAEEERTNRRILDGAYWSLSNRGVWA